MDYSTLAKEPCLSQVEWAPRFGAECIAQLVDYLAVHPRGVQPHELHLIGYSVGAHIAGLTANHLTFGKLGRITGEFFVVLAFKVYFFFFLRIRPYNYFLHGEQQIEGSRPN